MTVFRTEDEAIAADMAVFSFAGPHTHREFPKGPDGECTGETEMVWDSWTKGWREDFVQIEVPCEGCWL